MCNLINNTHTRTHRHTCINKYTGSTHDKKISCTIHHPQRHRLDGDKLPMLLSGVVGSGKDFVAFWTPVGLSLPGCHHDVTRSAGLTFDEFYVGWLLVCVAVDCFFSNCDNTLFVVVFVILVLCSSRIYRSGLNAKMCESTNLSINIILYLLWTYRQVGYLHIFFNSYLL